MNFFRSLKPFTLVAGGVLALSSHSPISAATPVLSCFDFFGSDLPPGSDGFCVDGFYNAENFQVGTGGGMGDLFPTSFTGAALFGQSPPSTVGILQSPLFGENGINVIGPNEVEVLHRVGVSLGVPGSDAGAGLRDRLLALGSEVRVTITASRTDGSTDPIPIKVSLDLNSRVIDPTVPNMTGDASTFMATTIRDISGNTVLESTSGNFFVDDGGGPQVNPGGDFIGELDVSEPQPGVFDLEFASMSMHTVDHNSDVRIESVFSNDIFTDGFESGDTSVWSNDSTNTFVINISSPDNNVLLNIIPEPSTTALLIPGLLWLGVRRRPQG